MLDKSKLNYCILPGNVSGKKELIPLHNKIYSFWRDLWVDTLKDMKLPSLNRNEFLRQDYITAILYEDKVVACHLYSRFDVNSYSTLESNYFDQVSEELGEYCGAHNIDTILTQEYLSVSSEVRKRISGISFPEVLMGMAVRLTWASKTDATGGTIRAGAPSVKRVSDEINTKPLNTIVRRYNMDHQFNIGSYNEIKLPDDFVTRRLIDDLWLNKKDYCYLEENNNENTIKTKQQVA